MKAFVTGGTGFIGSHLAEALLAQGAEVRCLVRTEPKWLAGLGIKTYTGDLLDHDTLKAACEGVDYVYHTAGVTRATDQATFEDGNVLGTLAVLDAVKAVAPQVKKVLVTSSLAAIGRCPAGIADENTPLDPISRYGESKAEMERRITSYQEELPLVVVRPPAVYGPREKDIFTFFKTVSRGVCPVVGDLRTPTLSLVHVRDLVRGMIQAAESEATVGETYFIGSEEQYSWGDVKDATAAALGHRAIAIALPPAWVVPVGTIVEGAARVFGKYPPLNKEKALEIRDACKMCSTTKARRDFGYRQQVSLREGITETMAWYREVGWL